MKYLLALILLLPMISQADIEPTNYELRVIISKQDAYISDMEDLLHLYAYQIAQLKVQKQYAEDQLIQSVSDGVK